MTWEPAAWGIMSINGTFESRVYHEGLAWFWCVWRNGSVYHHGTEKDRAEAIARCEKMCANSPADRRRETWRRSKQKAAFLARMERRFPGYTERRGHG